MRKYLNFLLLLFMTVLSADAYEVLVVKTGEIVTSREKPSVKKTETREDYKITVTYQFDSLLVLRDEADETKIRFEIDGFGIIQNSSSPAVPFTMDQYAMDSLSVAYLQGYNSETYDVQCNLAYSIDPTTQNNNVDSTTQAIKVVNSFKPGDIISSDNSQYYRGNQIFRVNIFPIQYNNHLGTARIHNKIEYTVERVVLDGNSNLVAYPVWDEAFYFNHNWVERGDPTTTQNIDRSYLIITVPEHRTVAQEFADWKKSIGYNSHIKISSNWTETAIKDSIASVYSQDHKLFYLLFMGDEDQVPPCQNRHHVKTTDSYVTDFPYACLDGPLDYIPDLCFGRMPYTTASEMRDVVNKTIAYDKDPSFGQSSVHASLFSYFQSSTQNPSQEEMGFVFNTNQVYLYSQGWIPNKVSRYYLAKDTVYPQSWSSWFGNGLRIVPALQKPNYAWNASVTDIINSFNQGSNLIIHRGHGSDSEWLQPHFSTFDFVKLKNTVLPIVLSLNCLTGNYITDGNFAKRLLGKPSGGCAAIIAATNSSLTMHNDAFMLGMINAIWPNPGLKHRALGANQNGYLRTYRAVSSIGEMMNQGLLQMEETCRGKFPGAPTSFIDEGNAYQKEIYHCFGDPGLCVYWDNNTDLSELVTRSDLPGRTIISGTRMVNVAIYDSVADVAYRVYTKDYTHRTSNPARVKVTVSLPGCKPVELPTTAQPIVIPPIIKSSIDNSTLTVSLEFGSDVDFEQYTGTSLVLRFGDGYQLRQSFIEGQKEYSFDLSGHPAITPGDFYAISLESLNNVIQTQKIRK